MKLLGLVVLLGSMFLGACASGPNSSSSSTNHTRRNDNSGCFTECDERYAARPQRLQSCKKICRQFSSN